MKSEETETFKDEKCFLLGGLWGVRGVWLAMPFSTVSLFFAFFRYTLLTINVS